MKSYAFKHSETIQTTIMEDRLYRKECIDQINSEHVTNKLIKEEEKLMLKEKMIKIGNVMIYVLILLYLFGIESAVIFILPLAPLSLYMAMLFIVRSKI